MKRTGRIVVTAGVVVALFIPVAIDRDGIPLSTYPMYSTSRGDEVGLVTANAIADDGDRVRLGLDVIGGSDDPLIVAGELRTAIREGRAEARCERIAERMPSRATTGSGASERGVVAVEVVTERHDVFERTLDRPSLQGRVVHARCEVPG